MYTLNLLSWNIRGIGKVEKHRAIKKLVVSNDVEILFVQESKLETVDVKLVKAIWNKAVDNILFSPARGLSGGILCCWDDNFLMVDFSLIRPNFILFSGMVTRWKKKCNFVNLYAPNDASDRKTMFLELANLMSATEGIWIVGGDFNTVRNHSEKLGFSFNVASMSALDEFIDDSGLVNLSLVGSRFTWSNLRDRVTMCRLDRVLVSTEVLSLIPGLTLKALPKSLSDHNPILVTAECFKSDPKPFKIFTIGWRTKVSTQCWLLLSRS
ncbi:hypothetical protein V6N13_028381 [Hibiscus sabdariffa]|uniref:Endonuclease/exonuclease/phosphatase domain-containing protein n=1 Tax=Hibiscus sabdariffa TaxID=183260 RepID=A0ABR2DBH9_9ROSI